MAVVAILVGCDSFGASSTDTPDASLDAAGATDGGTASDTGTPPPDGGVPGQCPEVVCSGQPAPSICTALDKVPTGQFKVTPGLTLEDLFVANGGCRGGGMVVTSEAQNSFTQALFFTEVGSTVPSKLHAEFDLNYELDGDIPGGSYIDLVQITTAPRDNQRSNAALAVTTRVGDVFATIFEPSNPPVSGTVRITPAAWHHVVTTTKLGADAWFSVSVDGAQPVLVSTNLTLDGTVQNGAAIAFGRGSQYAVPGIRVAFDNIRIATE